MIPATIRWDAVLRMWHVTVGEAYLGAFHKLADAEAAGIVESERQEAGDAA